jgi:hypothetical protein
MKVAQHFNAGNIVKRRVCPFGDDRNSDLSDSRAQTTIDRPFRDVSLLQNATQH